MTVTNRLLRMRYFTMAMACLSLSSLGPKVSASLLDQVEAAPAAEPREIRFKVTQREEAEPSTEETDSPSQITELVVDNTESESGDRGQPSPEPSTPTALTIDQWRSAPASKEDIEDGVELPEVRVEASRPGGLDIVEAVRKAIEWHPQLGESLGQLGVQREEVNVAEAGYLPQVNSGVSTEHSSASGRMEKIFNVSITQLLYDFGKTSGDVDVAEYAVDRDHARVLLEVDQLARDTAEAAIEVQRFQSMVEIADEQIAGIADIKSLAEKRSSLGAATRSDEFQALSRLESAKGLKLQFVSKLRVWQRRLQSFVGARERVVVSDVFPETLMNSCGVTLESLDDVPEVMRANAEEAVAVAAADRAQAELYPTLSLDADYNHYLDRNEADEEDDLRVGISLSSSLYKGGATMARNRAADQAMRAAQSARDVAYLEVSQLLNEANDQAISLNDRLAILNDRVLSIVETQKMYRQQYLSLGTRTLLDLLNAEQEIHQAQMDKSGALYDLRKLQIDCLYGTANIRDAFGLGDDVFQGMSIDDE